MHSQSIGESSRTLSAQSEASEIDYLPSKKQRLESLQVYKFLQILVLDQKEHFDKNVIWMHIDDIHELFGTKDESRHYVRIANYAYEVGIKNVLKGAICLKNIQRIEMRDLISKSKNGVDSVIISPLSLTNQNLYLKSIVLKIEFHNLLSNQTYYDFNKLQKFCSKKIIGRIVNINQTFKIKSKNKILTCVKELGGQVSEKKTLPFGLVTKDTEIYFENMNIEKISIVNGVKGNALDYCEFSIRKKINSLSSQVDINNTIMFIKGNESSVIDLNTINDAIFLKFNSKPLFEGLREEIEIDNQVFEIVLTEIIGEKTISMKGHCKVGLFLNQNTHIDFINYDNDLIILDNRSYIADLCSFKIKGIWDTPKKSVSSQRLKPWINLEELEKELIKLKEFVIGQNFKVKLSNCICLINFECAQNYLQSTNLPQNKGFTKCKWIFDIETKVSYTTEPYLDIKLISNMSTTNISKLTFEVTQYDDHKSFLLRDQSESDELLEVDLIEAAIKEIEYPIVEGQTIEVLISGEVYVLKAKNIKFENDESSNDMDSLGTITKDTVFTFKSNSDNSIKIIPKKRSLNLDKLIDTFKEIGLGGIEDQLNQLIRRVMIYQDSQLINDISLYGLKPIKGLILYGPPGTGKTTLARNLSKQLGCTSDRIRLVSGPEILNKYVGESEKNIRSLFDDAKSAQSKYGNKSPLFTIVFDEFDAIASKRDESSNKWHNSVVDQLLAVMDGLNELNNILVIGITNQINSLDPAIKRPGRFEFHLEIGLPNETGRLEIFEIYTRDLLKNNRLGTDVNLKELAKKTDGFSGADIEGLVRMAISYPVERLFKTKELQVEDKEALLRVSDKDFTNALRDLEKTREKERSKVPFGMYT